MAIGKKNTAFLNEIIELWKGLDESKRLIASEKIMGNGKRLVFYDAMNEVSK